MKKFLIAIIFGFFCSIFAQPKPFDPDYYKDTLKVNKSDEFKKLETYREKYKSLGFPLTTSWMSHKSQSFLADLFFHKGINIDKIEEYQKIGYFQKGKDGNGIYNDLIDNILRPIIVAGRLTSFEYNLYDNIATFDVTSIIKGREYYVNFPSSIKCYSRVRSLYTDSENITYSNYFGKTGPKSGDEFVLYLDSFTKDEANLWRRNPDEFGRTDIFYNAEGSYLDYNKTDNYEKNKSKAESLKDYLFKQLKEIDALKIQK